jgi:predicted flap endonuclease-1-like 5' DNA nuclease
MGINGLIWLSLTTTAIGNDGPLYQAGERGSGAPWFLIWLLLIIGLAAVVISWAMNRTEQKIVPAQAATEANGSSSAAEPHRAEAVAEKGPEPSPKSEAQLEAVPAEEVEEAAPTSAPSTDTAAEGPVATDDLTRIEGIGPKTSGVLREAGISSYDQLAAVDSSHLKQILKDANLRLGDPTTWPEQARLAASGDWDGLETLQDQLSGGRQVG